MWDLKDEVERKLRRMEGMVSVDTYLYQKGDLNFLAVNATYGSGEVKKTDYKSFSLDAVDIFGTPWTRRPKDAVMQDILDYYKRKLGSKGPA